jgi:hypothetical protein
MREDPSGSDDNANFQRYGSGLLLMVAINGAKVFTRKRNELFALA